MYFILKCNYSGRVTRAIKILYHNSCVSENYEKIIFANIHSVDRYGCQILNHFFACS